MDKKDNKESMNKENYKFFSHTKCEYFPCHEIGYKFCEDDFNCMFCYCPLYSLGDKCGGNFSYVNDVKDCSRCLLPHDRRGYDYIVKRFDDLVEICRRNTAER